MGIGQNRLFSTRIAGKECGYFSAVGKKYYFRIQNREVILEIYVVAITQWNKQMSQFSGTTNNKKKERISCHWRNATRHFLISFDFDDIFL